MKNKKILVLSTFTALLLVATIVGCTGTGGILFPGGGSLFEFFTPKFAYVFNGDGTNTITTWTVNSSTGALTVASSGVATNISGCCQVFMDVDPTSRFLFVPNRDNNTVSVFTVNSDGTITGPTGTDAATGGNTAMAARLHPSGKFLYVSNFTSNDVSTFSVGAGGALTPVGTPIAAGSFPEIMIMDWQGRFLYVTHSSDYGWDSAANDTINAYSINSQTGALTSVGTFPTGGFTPRGGMVDYSGQYLIVANRGNDGPEFGNIAVFKINSDGSLSAVAGSPFKAADQDSSHDNGPFNVAEAIVNGVAYIGTSNLDSNDLTIFSLDTATGKLTPVAENQLQADFSWPHYVAVDTSGKFGYVVDWSNNEITLFNLSNSGSPSVVGTPFTDGSLSEPTQLIFSH